MLANFWVRILQKEGQWDELTVLIATNSLEAITDIISYHPF